MKTVLLTGSSGFLGQILNKVLENTFQIYSLGRTNGNNIICDLSQSIPEIESSFDIVIHAAAKAHSIPKSENDIKEFYDVNFTGTVNLCNALSRNLPQSFIYISTVAVYGLEEGQLINESNLLNGNTPYSESKLLAENYLLNWADKNNVQVGILRLPLIAGPNPPGNLGAMINGIKRGRYLRIGEAGARKSMVWAEDVAKIIPKLAETGGIYNLTDQCHPSFEELENTIAAALGKKPPIKIPLSLAKKIAFIGDLLGAKSPINTEKLKKITSSLTFDDSKARKILGWQSTPVIQKLPYIL